MTETREDCESCGGRGFIEHGPTCGYSCDSCGGCYREEECEECEGEGTIAIERFTD